jgi:alpha-tubulin suppressor-like RCC1 family protein
MRALVALPAVAAFGCNALFGVDELHAPDGTASSAETAVGSGAGGTASAAAPGSSSSATGGASASGGAGGAPAGSTGSGGGVAEGPRLAVGSTFSCAVKANGSLWCWGDNTYGQLGDGSTIGTDKPVEVKALGKAVTAVAAGFGHACAVLAGGTLACWGYNFFGQLGIGGTAEQHLPTEVGVPPDGASTVGTGALHACALVSGLPWCWGRNASGQLGDGTLFDRDTPTSVVGTGQVLDIAPGGAHTCARESAGSVSCWGSNTYGQLGDGSMAGNKPSPVSVFAPPGGIVDVAAGDNHSCAVATGGSLWCWGHNFWGQIGDGTTLERRTPVQVTKLGSDVVDVEAGSSHTCARKNDGSLWCWGGNGDGQLGNGSTLDEHEPQEITALGKTVTAVAAAVEHTCARKSDGSLWCWGKNGDGQLGDGSTTKKTTPVPVAGSWP